MNPLLALLVIILAFGAVGRIDYECAQMSAHPLTTYESTHNASK
jgi:hypothetical protein